jgi:hypothetical protein
LFNGIDSTGLQSMTAKQLRCQRVTQAALRDRAGMTQEFLHALFESDTASTLRTLRILRTLRTLRTSIHLRLSAISFSMSRTSIGTNAERFS